jgi:hypothetical protein
MWILSWLPDSFLIWVINIILLVGVAGTVASILFKFVINYFPWIIPYRLVLQVVSVLLLIAGVYLKGGYAVEAEWRARVAELEAKIAVAEQQSKDANVKLEETIKQKNKVVKEKQVIVQTKIKEVEKIIDAECKVDPQVITILNQATESKK